jgi:hypothetical protein
MAGPDPETLTRQVAAFPHPPTDERYVRADDALNGTYTRIVEEWYPELKRLADAYAAGDVLREAVLAHVEAVPSVPLETSSTNGSDAGTDLAAAIDTCAAVADLPGWYADLRRLVDDDPRDLTLFERALHDFGYALAHGLFIGARSPSSVVRRLRVAYRSVGVRIDAAETDGGTERTMFTCPYRNVGADECGKRWVCHEKLDRVDDGYVTYLGERGIDYQRPRGCGGEQCYSEVSTADETPLWPVAPTDTPER